MKVTCETFIGDVSMALWTWVMLGITTCILAMDMGVGLLGETQSRLVVYAGRYGYQKKVTLAKL